MAALTVDAIVLRRFDVGESDRRLTLMTSDSGKMSAIARGARKSGSRLAATSEPLTLAKFHLASGRARRFVTQVEPRRGFPGLRSDFDLLTAALAWVELVDEATPWEALPDDRMALTLQVLAAMEHEGTAAPALLWGLVRLLREEGLEPDWSVCAVSGEELPGEELWFSARSGGFVSASRADLCGDAFGVSRLAYNALRRVGDLESPPAKLKRPGESLRVGLNLWRATLERELRGLSQVVSAFEGS